MLISFIRNILRHILPRDKFSYVGVVQTVLNRASEGLKADTKSDDMRTKSVRIIKTAIHLREF